MWCITSVHYEYYGYLMMEEENKTHENEKKIMYADQFVFLLK